MRNMVEGQMSIFDFLNDEPAVTRYDMFDLETVEEKVVVDILSKQLGLPFTYNDHREAWEAITHGATASIKMSHYASSVKGGKRYIGVGVSNKTGGYGCPCDSIEEAYKWLNMERIKKYMIFPRKKKAA